MTSRVGGKTIIFNSFSRCPGVSGAAVPLHGGCPVAGGKMRPRGAAGSARLRSVGRGAAVSRSRRAAAAHAPLPRALACAVRPGCGGEMAAPEGGSAAMPAACPAPPGPSAPGSWSRSLDRALEEAAVSGTLSLSGRKLRDYPRASAANHDLSDTTQAGEEQGVRGAWERGLLERVWGS